MKSLILGLLVISFSQALRAELPKEIAKLNGRSGTLVSYYNGKIFENETGLKCEIEAESKVYEEIGLVTTLEITTDDFQVNARASLEGAERSEEAGSVTYKTTENGKRPGGSVCGDYIPLTSYKKSATIQKNAVTIKETFRCGFSKTEIILTCNLK